jgi:hypothetical protein
MGRYIGYGTGALNYAVQELFSRFTEQLSASAGLVNIAPHGRASQSSTSKWSRQHDAQRAVMDVDTEFAFHTDVEDEPWWHLEFDGLQHPEYIIISNRHRPEFQDLAETLRVEESEDGTTWTLVHAGRVSFGASASGGLPLILPCRSQSPVRHIRLSLAERNPFHLSSVCVLAKQLVAPHRTGVTTFVANRSDGFGERLKSIVNAMALAHHFDGKFIVKWGRMSAENSAGHAIGGASEIFSSEFTSNHFGPVKGGISLDKFMKGGAETPPDGAPVIVPQGSLINTYPSLRPSISATVLSETFGKIKFSDQLQVAIDAAQNLDISPGAVGIHLRAGDIIYGKYRFNARYGNKVVPYPICLQFIKEQQHQSNQIVLFGQDEDLCRQISKATGAIFAADFHKTSGFNVYQAALFDIIAMSRCTRVVAGKSGFSQIAGVVGGFKTTEPQSVLPAEQAASVMLDTVITGGAGHSQAVSPSPLQAAFTAWYSFHVYKKFLTPENRISLLRHALRADPVNAFYAVVLALELFENGHAEEGYELIDHVYSDGFPIVPFGSLRDIVNTRHPDGTFALSDYLNSLVAMARSGSRTARVVSAALAQKHGQPDTCEALQETLEEAGRSEVEALIDAEK